MKVDKSIEIPMTIGVILQGIGFIIYLICIFTQRSFYPSNISTTELIVPSDFIIQCVILLLYVVFMLAMFTTQSSSRRTLCVIMLIIYAIIRIVSPYISVLSNIILSRKGSGYIAAAGTLSSRVGIITSPLTTVAAILVIVAVGRYGVISPSQNLGYENN